jgi:hypothetical protein
LAPTSRKGREKWGTEVKFWLEGYEAFDLEGTGRGVAAQERAEDAGGVANGADDAAELRVGYVSDGLIEIGMVENVEGLRAELEFCTFPVRNGDGLHES